MLTITASITKNEDDYEDRGVDLEIAENKQDLSPRRILGILFEGFRERLEAEGITLSDMTTFT